MQRDCMHHDCHHDFMVQNINCNPPRSVERRLSALFHAGSFRQSRLPTCSLPRLVAEKPRQARTRNSPLPTATKLREGRSSWSLRRGRHNACLAYPFPILGRIAGRRIFRISSPVIRGETAEQVRSVWRYRDEVRSNPRQEKVK